MEEIRNLVQHDRIDWGTNANKQDGATVEENEAEGEEIFLHLLNDDETAYVEDEPACKVDESEDAFVDGDEHGDSHQTDTQAEGENDDGIFWLIFVQGHEEHRFNFVG